MKLLLIPGICFLAMLTFAFNARSQEILFNYAYDRRSEVLDTANTGTHPWYLPIQSGFVDRYNAGAPSHFIHMEADPGEIPGKTRYLVSISSEGVGFEGYAIVNFLRLQGGKMIVDASYGCFSNNAGRQYASSFAGGESSTAEILQHNTLFFGVVPPAVVRRSFQNRSYTVLLEINAEQYQFRVFTVTHQFRKGCRAVNPEYLYGQFQTDWRSLLEIGSRLERSINASPEETLTFTTRRQKAANGKEVNLFPHPAIQEVVLTKYPGHRRNFSGGILSQYSHQPPLNPFIVGKINSIKSQALGGGLTRLVFDSTAGCGRIKKILAHQTILGNSLYPVYYEGKIKDGLADSIGELYLGRDCGGGAGDGYFVLKSRWKRGIPEGSFEYSSRGPDRADTLIAKGSLHNGRLDRKITKYNKHGSEESLAFYKDGEMVKDSLLSFVQFDKVLFNGYLPQVSTFYSAIINNQLVGIDRPLTDVNLSEQFNTQEGKKDFAMYVEESQVTFLLQDCNVIVPCKRNYDTKQLQPVGPATVYYANGARLETHWNKEYIIGGPSTYFFPPPPKNLQRGVEFETQAEADVVKGKLFINLKEQSDGGGFLGGIGNLVSHAITDPITGGMNVAGSGLKLARRNGSLKEFGNTVLSENEKQLGNQLQLDGNIVHILAETGQTIADITHSAMTILSDLNRDIVPLTADFKLTDKADRLQISTKGMDAIGSFLAKLPDFYDSSLYTILKMAFTVMDEAGTIESDLGKYMVYAAHGFPGAIENPNHPPVINHPSLSTQISSHFLEEMLKKTLNHKIFVNKGNLTSIYVKGPTILNYDPISRAINVGFSDGEIDAKVNLGGSHEIKNTFTIKGCNIEILPSMVTRDKKTYLELRAVLTYLDLKDVNTVADKMLAWIIQDQFFNEKPLDTLNLTHLLGLPIVDTVTGKRIFGTDRFEKQVLKDSIALNRSTWSIAGGYLQLSALLGVSGPMTVAGAVQRAVDTTDKSLPDDIKKLNCSTWPDIKVVPVPHTIADPDLQMALDGPFMEELIGDLFNRTVEFPFTEDLSDNKSNHFVSILKINQLLFHDKNMIQLDITGDIWFRWKVLGKKVSTKFSVQHLNLVVVPTIVKKDTVYFLNFDSQITKMDGVGIKEVIAKCLANFVNYKGYLNGRKADLSNLLNVRITSPLEKERIITPKITAVELTSDQTNYVLSIKIE